MYVLVLLSTSVGVCHGLDGLDIACSPENAETLVHNNNSQSPIAKRFIEPVQQFRHVSNSRGSHQNSPRPTSQSDLRTNHQNSTRPTSQSDPRANDKNSTHQIRWWMDPKLEQIGQVTQHTSGQLAALVQTVREGFANQTNMTQNTSGQLSALLETVREGCANQTNDTQHTSDHLAKTHALLDSGLHNLTSIMKNMSDGFAARLETISKVCANRTVSTSHTCDPCTCQNDTNHEDETANSSKKEAYNADDFKWLTILWPIATLIAVATIGMTHSPRAAVTSVDDIVTELKNLQTLFVQSEATRNELMCKVQDYQEKEAKLAKDTEALKRILSCMKAKYNNTFDLLDQDYTIQRLAENREAVTREMMLVAKERQKNWWLLLVKQICMQNVFGEWRLLRVHTNFLHEQKKVVLEQWMGKQLQRFCFNTWANHYCFLTPKQQVEKMVGRGMVVLARKNYAEYTKVIQINSELKAISKEYKERERIFQQAIAHNEARRKCACVMMCVCVCLLVLVTSGVIFAMHRPTTLTWQASMDGIPFKMYNASTDWVAYTQTLMPTWQVDWSQQYS